MTSLAYADVESASSAALSSRVVSTFLSAWDRAQGASPSLTNWRRGVRRGPRRTRSDSEHCLSSEALNPMSGPAELRRRHFGRRLPRCCRVAAWRSLSFVALRSLSRCQPCLPDRCFRGRMGLWARVSLCISWPPCPLVRLSPSARATSHRFSCAVCRTPIRAARPHEWNPRPPPAPLVRYGVARARTSDLASWSRIAWNRQTWGAHHLGHA